MCDTYHPAELMFSVRTIPLIPLFYSLTSGSENTLFSYLNLDSALGIVLSPTHEELHVMEGDANAELMKLFFSTCEKMSVTFQQNSVKVRSEERRGGKECRSRWCP